MHAVRLRARSGAFLSLPFAGLLRDWCKAGGAGDLLAIELTKLRHVDEHGDRSDAPYAGNALQNGHTFGHRHVLRDNLGHCRIDIPDVRFDLLEARFDLVLN